MGGVGGVGDWENCRVKGFGSTLLCQAVTSCTNAFLMTPFMDGN